MQYSDSSLFNAERERDEQEPYAIK